MLHRHLLLALAVVVAAGCGKGKDQAGAGEPGDHAKPAADKVASCRSDSLHTCREYSAANLEGGIDLAPLCTTVDKTAKYTDTACPTAKRIASCAMREGKDVYYEGYAIAAPDIEKDCKQSGGTFAGP